MNTPHIPGAVPPGADADSAPEIPPGMESQEKWDEPVAASGVRTPRLIPEDESSTAGLVEEGLEEADRELRLEADTEDEDPEETEDTNRPAEGILS